MDKGPQAFRTISEVSGTLDIPAHVLRFWESRFAQLRPMKSSGGRRYYRPEDVDLLRGIRELLYGDGLTIKGVQKIFREQGTRAVMVRGRPDLAAAPLADDVAAPEAPLVEEPADWDEPEALPDDHATPPEARRAAVAAAIARLEAVRARILAALPGPDVRGTGT